MEEVRDDGFLRLNIGSCPWVNPSDVELRVKADSMKAPEPDAIKVGDRVRIRGMETAYTVLELTKCVCGKPAAKLEGRSGTNHIEHLEKVPDVKPAPAAVAPSKPEFSKGDLVRVKEDCRSFSVSWDKGALYTVAEFDPSDDSLLVNSDKGPLWVQTSCVERVRWVKRNAKPGETVRRIEGFSDRDPYTVKEPVKCVMCGKPSVSLVGNDAIYHDGNYEVLEVANPTPAPAPEVSAPAPEKWVVRPANPGEIIRRKGETTRYTVKERKACPICKKPSVIATDADATLMHDGNYELLEGGTPSPDKARDIPPEIKPGSFVRVVRTDSLITITSSAEVGKIYEVVCLPRPGAARLKLPSAPNVAIEDIELVQFVKRPAKVGDIIRIRVDGATGAPVKAGECYKVESVDMHDDGKATAYTGDPVGKGNPDRWYIDNDLYEVAESATVPTAAAPTVAATMEKWVKRHALTGETIRILKDEADDAPVKAGDKLTVTGSVAGMTGKEGSVEAADASGDTWWITAKNYEVQGV